MWKTLSGRTVPDITTEVQSLVGDEELVLHIGTDSQRHGRHTDFVTVIAVLNPGKGGRVFYQRERVARTKSLAQKLFKEAWLSTEFALALCEVGSVESHERICVHVDVNPKAIHKSSRYLQQLVGLVAGQGFPVVYKPNAWAASRAADHAVKGKNWRTAPRPDRAA